MSILPEEILASVKRSMKTKNTRSKGPARLIEEAPFRVREVEMEDDQETEIDVQGDDDMQAELACDVYNLANKVVIAAPVAGCKLDDVKVKVAEDVITIRGTRKNPIEADDQEIHTSECFWGDFSRSIILPPNVDTTKIKATFKNAVLIVEIPKTRTARERVIKIIAG